MKQFIALFLALCISLSAAVVIVAADTVQLVSASEVTVTAGNTAYVTLRGENFKNIAALDVYVYYDPSVMTLSSTSNGSLLSGAQSSVNTSESGKLTLSLMSLNGINGSGTLLNIYFNTDSDCAEGTYPVTVAIGRAYDGNLSEATVKGKNGSVTVNKPIITEPFYIYSYFNENTLKKGDTLTAFVNSSYQSFVSAEFTVEYDSDLFAFDSVTFDPEIVGDGAVYSVNSSISGQVRIAYANNAPVVSYDLFAVNLRVIADKEDFSTINISASNVYREDLSLYLPQSASYSVYLTKIPETIDYPNAYFESDMLVVGEMAETVFFLEAGSNVAAADFTIDYDKSVFRCISVTAEYAVADNGGMVIVNENFSNGSIRFSYVNMSAYDDEDLPLVKIVWEVIKAPQKHVGFTSSAVGVVDAAQRLITLEHVPYSECIYVASVQEPTCVKEGSISYSCKCGETYGPIVIPKISEEECTHYTVKFIDYDGTLLSERSYHYGDAITEPEAPTREADKTYTYTFAGWDKEVVNCAGNAVYTATYSPEYIDYTVVFKNYNGSILSSKTYHYGDTVLQPETPIREADKTYTYTFAGWDKEVVNCAGNAVYTATYSPKYIDYTVKFIDYDGTLLSEHSYHYGDAITEPEAPTRESDREYHYSFIGWSETVVACCGDAVYTAQYKTEPVKLTHIVITQKPDKLTYLEGEPFENEGLTVYAYYDNGMSEEITDYTVNGSTDVPGIVTVTVDYNGKTDSFEIVVEEKPKYKLGDVNGNGEIDKYDYIHVKRFVLHTLSFTDVQQLAADVDVDGNVNIYDYILIKRHVMETYVIA